MKNFLIENKLAIVGILLFILVVSFFFDKGLPIGLGLLFILSGITFFVLNKLGFKDKKIYLLFLIVLAIHLATTLFMHYANFQPFAGGQGDYSGYQIWAVEASQCFKQGIFSIKDIVLKYPDFYTGHYYPVVVGALYALTMPAEIIGLMLNVWLVAITIIFVYLIISEIGGATKNAFIIGLITTVYPSYVFNSGLLLKDTLEICFIILGLLFLIKTIKKFTWYNFLVLYLAIFCATHFRFYIGYALIITFIFSWFLFSKMDFKKRIIYGIIFIIILGFIPQIASNQGYYGIDSVRVFLNYEQFTYYRQVAWNPVYNATTPTTTTPTTTTPTALTSVVGFDSSFSVEKGLLGYAESFVYVLLGPFPWQIKYLRQSFALIETIPWYFLLFFVVDGIIILFKKRVKEAAPLLIFSIIVMVVIAVFYKNFGLIVRIRIPVFISLLCLASFGFNKNNIICKTIAVFHKNLAGRRQLIGIKNEKI